MTARFIQTIFRISKFLSFNVPFMIIGICVLAYPEIITEELKTKILGLTVFYIGLKL